MSVPSTSAFQSSQTPYTSAFYNPGQYAAPDQNWYQTPYATLLRQQNLPAAWYSYGRQLGVPDDNSPFGRWFDQQYGTFNQGFASATMENPYLSVDDYTPTLGNYQDWYRRFMDTAPQLRGERNNNYGNTTRVLGW